jgi:cell division protein FtsB
LAADLEENEESDPVLERQIQTNTKELNATVAAIVELLEEVKELHYDSTEANSGP